jgi:hypothetical protein
VKPSQPSKEQQLLFDLLKGKIPSGLEGINTKVLFALFQRHRLFPMASPLLPLLDEGEQLQWKKAIQLRSLISLGLVSRLLELKELLDSEGISILPLKGPVLAQALYGDVSQRHMRDLDVLVNEDDLQKALKALQASGYKRKFPKKELTGKQWNTYLKHQYDVGLIHNEHGTLLELHTRISYPALLGGMEQLITSEQISIDLAGRPVPCLSSEAAFLYLAVHGAHHLFFRLFWLRDLKEALNRWDLDHARVISLAEQMDIERILGIGLTLAAYFTGMKPPADYDPLLKRHAAILDRMERHCHRAILTSDYYGRRNRINVLMFAMKFKPGWMHRRQTLSELYHRWYIRRFLSV